MSEVFHAGECIIVSLPFCLLDALRCGPRWIPIMPMSMWMWMYLPIR
jgi:hypothetical protein